MLPLRRQRWRHTLKFYIKGFYVMGKALLGELSCMGTGLFFFCLLFTVNHYMSMRVFFLLIFVTVGSQN